MLTGDNAGAAHSVAAAAGLDPVSVHSSLLPEDKLRQARAHGLPISMSTIAHSPFCSNNSADMNPDFWGRLPCLGLFVIHARRFGPDHLEACMNHIARDLSAWLSSHADAVVLHPDSTLEDECHEHEHVSRTTCWAALHTAPASLRADCKPCQSAVRDLQP